MNFKLANTLFGLSSLQIISNLLNDEFPQKYINLKLRTVVRDNTKINTELDQSEPKGDCHESFETFVILLNNTFTDGFLSATLRGWTRQIVSDLFVVGGVGCVVEEGEG